MKRYIFKGYSDDTFGEYGTTQIDYDNCASGEPIQFDLFIENQGGVCISGLYNNDINKGDGWMIGVSTLDEDKPVDWPITIQPGNEGYRNLLVIDAPDEAILVCHNNDETSCPNLANKE